MRNFLKYFDQKFLLFEAPKTAKQWYEEKFGGIMEKGEYLLDANSYKEFLRDAFIRKYNSVIENGEYK